MKINTLRRIRGGRTARGHLLKRVWLKIGHAKARRKLIELSKAMPVGSLLIDEVSDINSGGEPIPLMQPRASRHLARVLVNNYRDVNDPQFASFPDNR